MASLLKRKTEASGQIPAWHPNFRNDTKLPDVKVIRTSFFLNAGVAVLLLGTSLWVAFQEYNRIELRQQIARAKEQIEQDEAANKKAVALFREFQAEERRAKELEEFQKSRPSMRDFILQLSATVPEEIALSGLEVAEDQVVLRGFVSGLPAKASGVASAFENALRQHPEIGRDYSSITLTTIGRDNATGRMSFAMTMKRTPKAPEPKKGKK